MLMHLSFERLAVVVLIGLLSLNTHAQNSKAHRARAHRAARPARIILFVCEHGAAKSVIAAAYFDVLARKRGLNYKAVFRGTNPEKSLAPSAEKGLREDGISTNGWKPEVVTQENMKEASQIVTLGCVLPGADAQETKIAKWDEIPSVSDDYHVARDEIKRRVQSLVDDLARKESKRRKRPGH